MNEETFNMSMRKFLKKVGITSQREIEQAVQQAIETGTLQGNESLQASIVLQVPALDLHTEISGEIATE